MDKENHVDKSYYKALMRRMVFIVISVSFTPMILITCTLLYQFKLFYHEKTYAHLEELVQKHKLNIDVFLREKVANVHFLSANSPLEKLSDEEHLGKKLEALKREFGPVFVDIGLVDNRGLQVAYTGPFKLEDADYSESDWFKKAINREFFISDVFLGLRGHPHFIIAVRQNWNNKNWLLRATINFEAFNTLVENIRIGETGCVFIINKKGSFQTKPRIEITSTKIDRFLKEYSKPSDNVQISMEADASGEEFIYVSSKLNNSNWLMVCQQNTSDAFKDLYYTGRLAMLILLIGGISIIVMALFTSKRMVAIVYKTDKENRMMNQQVIETGKLASIGELAAGIAHEINNPVAIMVEEAGWIGDLLEEDEFAKCENLEEFKRALDQINTQGKRCKGITHKLLSFARKTDSRIRDVEINSLITEMTEISAQMAKYSNVTIVTELEENLPYIMISPSEMQQVLLNLINNALYAMEKKGGTIIIASKLSKLERDHIVITVEDNGPGIPESNLSRVFDPFFTTKPVGKGTGLGLSICYGIIQKLGGKIDVNSIVDVGTKFRIWIPFQEILSEAFNTLVENIRIGETGCVFIINKKGSFQTKPRIEITSTKIDRFLKEYSKPSDNVQISMEADASGEEFIYVSSKLNNSNWLMVCQQNTSDAFKDLYYTGRLAMLILLIGGISIIVMALFTSKRMVAIVYKTDKENRMMNQQVIETGKLASIGELAAGIAHGLNKRDFIIR